MPHANKSDLRDQGELSFDISKARLVRRGPRAPMRLSLRALRESAGKTQTQVAKVSGLAQPEISKLESAYTLDDRQISTVRRYLAALGDDLDLVSISKFGHRMVIAGGDAVDASQNTAAVGRPALAAVDPKRGRHVLSERVRAATLAFDDLVDGFDWEQRVMVAMHAIGALALVRNEASPEHFQAVAIGQEAIKLLAGAEYGDAETPERIRRMHKKLVIDREQAAARKVHSFAMLLPVATKQTSQALIAWALVGSVQDITGENLSRAGEQPDAVLALLRKWHAKPNRRKGELTSIGVLNGIRKLAGAPGEPDIIRKRSAASARRARERAT